MKALSGLLDNFSLADIGDYAVIIVFVVIALVLVGHFMDAGPKKWLAILGILVGGGLALTWTRRRHRYTEKKLQKHNEGIAKLREMVEERDKMIAENNEAVVRLQQERQALATGAAIDQEKLSSLDQRIDARLEAHRKLAAEIDAKEADLMADLERARTSEALPSVDEIFRSAGVVGKRPLTRQLIPDPNPVSAGTTERVVVDGYALKEQA
jgi:hypothetical protein